MGDVDYVDRNDYMIVNQKVDLLLRHEIGITDFIDFYLLFTLKSFRETIDHYRKYPQSYNVDPEEFKNSYEEYALDEQEYSVFDLPGLLEAINRIRVFRSSKHHLVHWIMEHFQLVTDHLLFVMIYTDFEHHLNTFLGASEVGYEINKEDHSMDPDIYEEYKKVIPYIDSTLFGTWGEDPFYNDIFIDRAKYLRYLQKN